MTYFKISTPHYHKIEVGDKVHVDINNAPITVCHEAIVRGTPQGQGDSWVFEDLRDNKIHYISEGCTITLLEKICPNCGELKDNCCSKKARSNER